LPGRTPGLDGQVFAHLIQEGGTVLVRAAHAITSAHVVAGSRPVSPRSATNLPASLIHTYA
jgi:hypothetical protein